MPITALYSRTSGLEASNTPPEKLPNPRHDVTPDMPLDTCFPKEPNPLELAYFWAHMLLEQQKRANLHIAFSEAIVTKELGDKSVIAQTLNSLPELRSDLQNFENIKTWNTSKKHILESNEDFIMSLLKLLLDREDVQMLDWNDVGKGNFDQFFTKYQKVKSEHEGQTQELKNKKKEINDLKAQIKKEKNENKLKRLNLDLTFLKDDQEKLNHLIELSQLHLQIMDRKIKIFEFFLDNKRGISPLKIIQNQIWDFIAPAITDIKSWDFFGTRCLELATNLTLKLKNPTQENLKLIREMILQIEEELLKYKHLTSSKTPTLEKIDAIKDEGKNA